MTLAVALNAQATGAWAQNKRAGCAILNTV
jgi:hypothetical protein